MKLSNFFKQNVICDGEFETLGKLASRPDCSMLTFLNSSKYLPALYDNSSVSCIICTQEVADILAPEKPYGIVISCAPQADFYNLHNSLAHHAEYAGAKFDTVIGKNCTISPLACIAPQNVKIGDNVIIEEFVSIKEGTLIGDDCVIRSGSVLGAEGFEFSINNGNIIHVIHTGKVLLGNRVEVQHNSVIGRAVLPHDNTTIGSDSKIDSIVMVGHNATVGKRVLISAYSSVGGGCIIEDYVCIAPCSCIKNRCIVHRNAHVTLGSVVVQNVNEGQTVTGNFATDHAEFLNNMLSLKRLHRK